MSYCQPLGIPHSEILEWAPEDLSKALAFKLEEAGRCQMCGTADWEWEQDRRAYEPVIHICHGCYLKDIKNEELDNAPGRQVILVPPETITYEQRLAQVERAKERQRLEREGRV